MPSPNELRALPAVLLALAAAAGVASAAERAEHSCHVDGLETPVLCVTLEVPRDYDRADAGSLALTAVIIPATTGRPAPDPLLLLAGGPGQAATSLPALLPALVTHVRRERDLVLLDVRGTGLSEPLECELSGSPIREGASEAHAAGVLEEFRAAAAHCAEALGERAHHHTSREVVEDIERFRAARGYDRINLWGGSYGTRVAQHYVRAYPQRVRAVVLDAVAPTDVSVLVTGAHTPDAALAKLLDACGGDAACDAAFPDLGAKLERLLAAVSDAPIEVAAVDPVSGRIGTARLDYLTIANAVRVALYGRATTEMLPFAIDAAAAGHFTPLLGILGAVAGGDAVALGAQFSMLCAEDWPVARAAGAAARTGGFMRDGYFAFFDAACEVWPREVLPAEMLAPLDSRVPVLAISGAWDPVTPPELAERALAQFAAGAHVVVPNGFHTNSQTPCVARIVAAFLAEPGVGGGRGAEAAPTHACVDAVPPPRFATGPSY